MASRFLKRYILRSDAHGFVGRVMDLSIVGMHFDTYEELCEYEDAKYVWDVYNALCSVRDRVESLNMVAAMLWPNNLPEDFKHFPISRYEWLRISVDVFLVRYISVVDCLIILASEVLDTGLPIKSCTLNNLKKTSAPALIISHLDRMIGDQGELRAERNRRVHHGLERAFSSDDQMLEMAALFEHRYSSARGENGRPLPVNKLFREGLVELQRDFNAASKLLVRRIDVLYDMNRAGFAGGHFL